MDVTRQRMRNERLVGAPFASPEAAVEWLGAVQAQDFAGAKWALGQRTRRSTDADVEEAFRSGRILRTHVMRPTWHFVMPADIRWMLALTAPRVRAASAYYYRQLDLDERTLSRSNAALVKALRGGKHLTREELARALQAAGIVARGPRLGLLMMYAELEAVICSGPRRGKQFTYALLDERVPPTAERSRDEALAELARRYFTSHGPALSKDFAWWSGLTSADAMRGIELAGTRLGCAEQGGKTHWFAPSTRLARVETPVARLLPNYDEYIVAYKDHGAHLSTAAAAALRGRDLVVANHIVVIDGWIVGGWRRTFAGGAVVVDATLVRRLDERERSALRAAVDRYGRFLGMPAELVVAPVRRAARR